MPLQIAPTRRALLGGIAAGLAFASDAGAFAAPAPAQGPDLSAIAQRQLQRIGNLAAFRDRIGIVDFGLPSDKPRLHILEIETGGVVSLLVAHGRGSDPDHRGWVQRFSNLEGSNASSEGAYVTSDYYVGRHGRSMRLRGLDPSNSNAEARAIVVHAATYVDGAVARTSGMIGRSEGCFAVARADLDQTLTSLGPGRLLIAGKFS
jgi:hypothetical protein